ncbi:hypothetical protein APY04_2531 [Hyphomicrobium sulfonivorans]|uniref:Uncharacterized protein n=1 Tax=Hyphomicrobium sulfonivorans TaxID=121290 RepID=A0A109BD22_HYPSL|nr:hypothetical protein APY04_2531 [Hyphomicrobium sulfonivorans]
MEAAADTQPLCPAGVCVQVYSLLITRPDCRELIRNHI